ncbi:MFS transporter [Loktanella sp. IMCC34160]|uniref:MFS transporter n=1 Tax=Loktanella sp. IMCC34160 TaxID=2510646 RepID=UPI0010F2F794|nr:MFS transporter [Loktanella sp. IMCC34160]RYG89219.1 MFS transporter [Loktanella sp. IMCC34160]
MRAALSDPVVLAIMVSQLVVSTALYYLFPAMVMEWAEEFGWSLGQIMGAFSIALAIQGLTSRLAGRLIDLGKGPMVMMTGAVICATGLVLLTSTSAIWQFHLIWAGLGCAMGLTLYDTVFGLLVRSRDTAARDSIAAITLVTGLASSAAFTLTAQLGDTLGWRGILWLLAASVLCINLPLMRFAARRLERDRVRGPEAPRDRASGHSSAQGYWFLTSAMTLSALALGMILSHLLPLMAWLGLDSRTAFLAAALVGVSQVAGRLGIAVLGRERSAHSLAITCLLGLAVAPMLLLGSAVGPAFVFGFALLHGACYGISSIMRPLVIRDVLGHAGFGKSQGAVMGPAFMAFGAAPFLAAILADAAGYSAVLGVCVLAQALSAGLLSASTPRAVQIPTQ